MTLHSPRRHRYTFRDYLELEEGNPVRHEFFAGQIYAMAGGTPEHAALAASVIASLLPQFRGSPGRVHSSDLRVRALDTGLATYADVTVVCGPYEYDPESRTTVTNPRLVVEITSESTEDYDRGEKLDSYRRIPSVATVILVSHRERSIEVFERGADDTWRRTEARRGGRVRIVTPPCELVVDEVYDAAGGPT